jgi:hypothetical protein
MLFFVTLLGDVYYNDVFFNPFTRNSGQTQLNLNWFFIW